MMGTVQTLNDWSEPWSAWMLGVGWQVAPAAGLASLLEPADNLLRRMRAASDETRQRRPGWRSVAVVALFALLILPMGAPRAAADTSLSVPVLNAATAQTMGPKAPPAQQDKYTDQEVQGASVATFFERLATPQRGKHQFAPMWALQEKVATGGKPVVDEILERGAQIALDDSAPMPKRWHTCYVLSGTGDPRAIPVLGTVLTDDLSSLVRSVAACAIGAFDDDQARALLMKAAQTEKDPKVHKSIVEAYNGKFLKPTQVSVYAKADRNVREYLEQRVHAAAEKGLWLHDGAFSGLSERKRRSRAQAARKALDAPYGRDLCPALAEAGAIGDPLLTPALMRIAGYKPGETADERPVGWRWRRWAG